MKATIDIKTPAGQSLEGFPVILAEPDCPRPSIDAVISMVYYDLDNGNHELHKGDTITIRIEE